MKNKIHLKLIPDSAFLLGGVSVDPAFDAVTALDKERLPYLTATAIKGALRMEFEAFVRGVEKAKREEGMREPGKNQICDLEKEEDDEDGKAQYRGCGICLSCRLFGGGNNEGKLRFNAAFLKDKENLLPSNVRDDILKKGRREGVSISRSLGKARDGSYYSTMTFPCLKGIREISFETTIDIIYELKNDEPQYLEVFFAFMKKTGFFMGAGKSTGLGNFQIQYHIPDEFVPTTAVDTSNTKLKLFRLRLQTKEPLAVGNLKNQYIIDTLPYIPASTIGGSIGFGFKRNGIDDDTLRSLFIEKKSFSPFNFYRNSPYPKPLSLRAPKGKEEEEEKREQKLISYSRILS